MNKFFKVLDIISLIIVAIGLIIDLIPNIYTNGFFKIVFYALPMILIFASMIVKIKTTKDKTEKYKIKNKSLKIIFIIYCIAILSLLLLDSTYRMGNTFKNISVFSKENFELNANIIPFKTIMRYTKTYVNHTLNIGIIAVNLIGNLIAFMPARIFSSANLEW